MNSHRCKPLGSPAQPACIAVPIHPLSPAQSNDCRPFRADALPHALRPTRSPQNPPGIRGPPRSPARPLPTNIPLGTPPRSAASPVARHLARPLDRNSFSRHPKRSRAIAQVRPDLPDVPAGRSAAPQIPRGIHGPPRSPVHRSPTNIPPGTPPRCAAGSNPHPRACLPRSSAALHHPTSSAQSIRLPDFLQAARTPPGSKPGTRGPPRSLLRHIPTNIPAGTQPRSSVSPAPRRLASPPCNNSVRRHLKSSQSAFRGWHNRRSSTQTPPGIHGLPRSRVRPLPTNTPADIPRRSPASPSSPRSACPPGKIAAARHPKSSAPPDLSRPLQVDTRPRPTPSAFSEFACSSPSQTLLKTRTVRLRQLTALPHEPQSIYCRPVTDFARAKFPEARAGKGSATPLCPIIFSIKFPG
jgi:hypothetical protein